MSLSTREDRLTKLFSYHTRGETPRSQDHRLRYIRMTSSLCNLCQSFDIRELLLHSAEQEPDSVKSQLTGNVNADIAYRKGLPKFFKYHPTLAALKEAHTACILCKTIWELWSASPQAGSEADEWLDKTGQGQIYIGTSGSNVTKIESPSVTISQRPLNESPRILCNFEVFAIGQS